MQATEGELLLMAVAAFIGGGAGAVVMNIMIRPVAIIHRRMVFSRIKVHSLPRLRPIVDLAPVAPDVGREPIPASVAVPEPAPAPAPPREEVPPEGTKEEQKPPTPEAPKEGPGWVTVDNAYLPSAGEQPVGRHPPDGRQTVSEMAAEMAARLAPDTNPLQPIPFRRPRRRIATDLEPVHSS